MIKLMPVTSLFNIEGFYSAFSFSWNKDFIFNGERHNFWEIVFVKSGTVEVTEDENVYTLGAGEIIFHAPMEFHRIKSHGGTSPKGYILSIGISGALPKQLSEGIFNLDHVQMNEYEKICELAVKFAKNPSEMRIGREASLLLSAFIIKLLENARTGILTTRQSASEYRRIVSFMIKNVEKNLTVTDIANQTAVSVSYIKMLFGIYAGIAPKTYFNDLRIAHAADLLNQGYSVTEVSDRMNFSSPCYFSLFYKKHTGLPPSKNPQRNNC